MKKLSIASCCVLTLTILAAIWLFFQKSPTSDSDKEQTAMPDSIEQESAIHRNPDTRQDVHSNKAVGMDAHSCVIQFKVPGVDLPVPGVNFRSYRANEQKHSSLISDANGVCKLSLAPGLYLWHWSLQGYSQGWTVVDVANSISTAISVHPYGRLRLQVRDEQAQPIPNVPFTVGIPEEIIFPTTTDLDTKQAFQSKSALFQRISAQLRSEFGLQQSFPELVPSLDELDRIRRGRIVNTILSNFADAPLVKTKQDRLGFARILVQQSLQQKTDAQGSARWAYLPAGSGYRWLAPKGIPLDPDPPYEESRVQPTQNGFVESVNDHDFQVSGKFAIEPGVETVLEIQGYQTTILLGKLDYPLDWSSENGTVNIYEVSQVTNSQGQSAISLENPLTLTPSSSGEFFTSTLKPGPKRVDGKWEANDKIYLVTTFVDVIANSLNDIGILTPKTKNPLLIHTTFHDELGKMLALEDVFDSTNLPTRGQGIIRRAPGIPASQSIWDSFEFSLNYPTKIIGLEEGDWSISLHKPNHWPKLKESYGWKKGFPQLSFTLPDQNEIHLKYVVEGRGVEVKVTLDATKTGNLTEFEGEFLNLATGKFHKIRFSPWADSKDKTFSQQMFLPPGQYQALVVPKTPKTNLQAQSRSYFLENFEVKNKTRQHFTWEARPGLYVSGIYASASNQPLAGEFLYFEVLDSILRPTKGKHHFAVHTSADGSFLIPGVPPNSTLKQIGGKNRIQVFAKDIENAKLTGKKR